jgi:hypothetical protein
VTQLPARIQTQIDGYLKKLEDSGATIPDLDFAKEFLPERALARIESGDDREDELHQDVHAAWRFIYDVMKRKGVRL